MKKNEIVILIIAFIFTWVFSSWVCAISRGQTGMTIPYYVEVGRNIFSIMWFPLSWIPTSWLESWGMTGLDGLRLLSICFGLVWGLFVCVALIVIIKSSKILKK